MKTEQLRVYQVRVGRSTLPAPALNVRDAVIYAIECSRPKEFEDLMLSSQGEKRVTISVKEIEEA